MNIFLRLSSMACAFLAARLFIAFSGPATVRSYLVLLAVFVLGAASLQLYLKEN